MVPGFGRPVGLLET